MADADEMDVHEIALLNMSGEKFGIGAKCDRRGSNHVCRMKNRRALMVKPRNEIESEAETFCLMAEVSIDTRTRILESTEPRTD